MERSRDKKSAQLLRGVFMFFGLRKVSTLSCGSRQYEAIGILKSLRLAISMPRSKKIYTKCVLLRNTLNAVGYAAECTDVELGSLSPTIMDHDRCFCLLAY